MTHHCPEFAQIEMASGPKFGGRSKVPVTVEDAVVSQFNQALDAYTAIR